MSTLVLQPASTFAPHAGHMKVHSFKGDQDILLDRLIAASQRKEVALDTLQERPLVPYFDSSEASTDSFQALQMGRHGVPTKPLPVPVAKAGRHGPGLKRAERSSGALASSPPKKENEVLQARHHKPAPATSGGSSASGSASDTEMTSAPQLPRKQRAAGNKKGKSPQRKQRAGDSDMAALAAASAAAGAALRTPGGRRPAAPRAPALSKFAGPAFTNSPTPDCLPIPTSSLLLQDAADTLRSRLTL